MRWLASLILALGLVVSADPANGQRLFATLGAGGGTSSLLEIDPATGALVQTIGNVGYLVNGMTWDATTSTLYATTSTNSAAHPDGLITINVATGAGTPVGTGAGQLVNVPACNAAGVLYGWTEESDNLVLWNKAAGTVTVVGASGVGTWEQGLAFDTSGVLYLVNGNNGDVYTMNTATGAGTSLGTLGVRAHHGSFHPTTNLYYGLDATAESGAARNLIVANVATPAVVNTIPTLDNLHTLAFIGGGAPATPTLTGLSPDSGTIAGGMTVTISGTNLSGATSVTFGGVAATITGNTATSITVTTPPHAAGLVDVVVTTPGGTATLQAAYIYVDTTAIPTLSGWMLGLMAALLGVAAVLKIRS